MIVHAQVDPAVVVAAVAAVLAHDEQRCRLSAASISAALIGGLESTQQEFRETGATSEKRVHECVDDIRAGKDVALRSDVLRRPSAGPIDASGTCVRSGASVRVDDAQLPVVA